MSARQPSSNPKCVFLFSGKRKSGKDFITDLLFERLGSDNAVVIRLSAPIKSHWAKSKGLDLSKLLDSSSYKETYRQDMIKWGETVRANDYGYFCRHALEISQAFQKAVWIVSDARRKTDIQWFQENYDNVKTVRIFADDDIRKQRGWTYIEGVDDAESECDLDDFSQWDIEIKNNGNSELLKENLNFMCNILKPFFPITKS